jgi:hypothetical protein
MALRMEPREEKELSALMYVLHETGDSPRSRSLTTKSCSSALPRTPRAPPRAANGNPSFLWMADRTSHRLYADQFEAYLVTPQFCRCQPAANAEGLGGDV